LAARAIDGFDILGPSALAAHEAAQPWTRDELQATIQEALRQEWVYTPDENDHMAGIAARIALSRPLATTPSEPWKSESELAAAFTKAMEDDDSIGVIFSEAGINWEFVVGALARIALSRSMVAMPSEPTAAMIEAGAARGEEFLGNSHDWDLSRMVTVIYTAMAKAAPVVDRRRVCAVCRSEFERTP
jgi:hypothetical protein